MTRVVLDTNVLMSAAIRPGGKPDQILRQLPARFDLVISKFILAELETSDRHLLKLQQYETVRIVNPEEFLRILAA